MFLNTVQLMPLHPKTPPSLASYKSRLVRPFWYRQLIEVVLEKRPLNGCTSSSCLEKEIVQGTIPGARRRGRPCTAWVDNIKMWTGLHMEESIRMTEDRDKWRKYVHGVANPRIEDG